LKQVAFEERNPTFLRLCWVTLTLNPTYFSNSYFKYIMRIRWDEAKRQRVLAERDIDFGQLNDLLYTPYLEDQRSELPEQYRIIGFADGQLTTFIVEYRADKIGEYIWVVTAWKSTKQEQRSYEQRVY
jgi:uncharacterized DUF497 family protein